MHLSDAHRWQSQYDGDNEYIPSEISAAIDVANIVDAQVIVETGVVLFPGIGYGQNGEGHIRIAVVHDIPKLKEAFCRLEPYLKSQKRH